MYLSLLDFLWCWQSHIKTRCFKWCLSQTYGSDRHLKRVHKVKCYSCCFMKTLGYNKDVTVKACSKIWRYVVREKQSDRERNYHTRERESDVTPFQNTITGSKPLLFSMLQHCVVKTELSEKITIKLSFCCFPSNKKSKRTSLQLIKYVEWLKRKFWLLWVGVMVG